MHRSLYALHGSGKSSLRCVFTRDNYSAPSQADVLGLFVSFRVALPSPGHSVLKWCWGRRKLFSTFIPALLHSSTETSKGTAGLFDFNVQAIRCRL